MKKISNKRKKQLTLYQEKKKEMFLIPLKQGKLKCFLSNTPIRIPTELKGESDDILMSMIEIHHIEGERENEHLYDPEIMQPVLRYYHTLYHNTPIEKLMMLNWFQDYMLRIKIKYPKLWQKELDKLLRSWT